MGHLPLLAQACVHAGAVHFEQSQVGVLAVHLYAPVGLQARAPSVQGLLAFQPEQATGAVAHPVVGQQRAVACAVLGVGQFGLCHPQGPPGRGAQGCNALSPTGAGGLGGVVLPGAQVDAPLLRFPAGAHQGGGLVAGPAEGESSVAARQHAVAAQLAVLPLGAQAWLATGRGPSPACCQPGAVVACAALGVQVGQAGAGPGACTGGLCFGQGLGLGGGGG